MTETTKEQREGIALLIANQPHNALIEVRRFDLVDLLADSARLAAIEVVTEKPDFVSMARNICNDPDDEIQIEQFAETLEGVWYLAAGYSEAVTGEEMWELVERLAAYLPPCRFRAITHTAEDDIRSARDALLSLSAKVAEQAEEIEALNLAIHFAEERGRDKERARTEAAETTKRAVEYSLTAERGHYKLNMERFEEGYREERGARQAAEAERDTIRHLLTETAVPALKEIKDCPVRHPLNVGFQHGRYKREELKACITYMKDEAENALSTILANLGS